MTFLSLRQQAVASDYPEDILKGNSQEKDHQQGETDNMHPSLRFWRYAFSSAYPLEKDKGDSSAVQRRQGE